MTTMLRSTEAAARLGLSVREVLLLIDRGELPRGKDERGRLVIAADAVEAFAAQH